LINVAYNLVFAAVVGLPVIWLSRKAGLPWFEYYSDSQAVEGSEKLATVKSVAQFGEEKGDVPLPENQSVKVENVIKLRKGLKEGQARAAIDNRASSNRFECCSAGPPTRRPRAESLDVQPHCLIRGGCVGT